MRRAAGTEVEGDELAELERRRVALRKQALDQLGGRDRPPEAPAKRPASEPGKADEGEPDTTAGLLAAKRKLRARYEEESADGSGPGADR